MEIRYSDEFKEDLRKIKDKRIMLRTINAVQSLESMPERGKPLRYGHKGERRLRIGPFRVLYCIERERIDVLCFEHRGKVY
jgi:mRNA-degrading endonuclease RelE of RelBE toxin-antitoxin system